MSCSHKPMNLKSEVRIPEARTKSEGRSPKSVRGATSEGDPIRTRFRARAGGKAVVFNAEDAEGSAEGAKDASLRSSAGTSASSAFPRKKPQMDTDGHRCGRGRTRRFARAANAGTRSNSVTAGAFPICVHLCSSVVKLLLSPAPKSPCATGLGSAQATRRQ
jgi:hypothetical protein